MANPAMNFVFGFNGSDVEVEICPRGIVSVNAGCICLTFRVNDQGVLIYTPIVETHPLFGALQAEISQRMP